MNRDHGCDSGDQQQEDERWRDEQENERARRRDARPAVQARNVVYALRKRYELVPIGTTARLAVLEDRAERLLQALDDDDLTGPAVDPAYDALRAALDATPTAETAAQLDRAVRQREAAPGDPSQGPYPASVGEVADEVLVWLRKMDQTAARGLAYAVLVKLGDVFAQDPHGPVEIDALRHMYNG